MAGYKNKDFGNYDYGKNGVFSEENFRRLEKAVNLLEEHQKKLEKYYSTIANQNERTAKVVQASIDVTEEIAKLTGERITDHQTLLNDLVQELRLEREIKSEKVDAEIKQKDINKAMKELQERLEETEKGYSRTLDEQRKYNKLQENLAKELAKYNDGSEERIELEKQLTAELEKQKKKIEQTRKEEEKELETDKERLKLKKQDAMKSYKEQHPLMQALGINSADIQALKDGTYALKGLIGVLTSVVNLFFGNMDAGIERNFNTTETTLNRITASNSGSSSRLSWSKGKINTSNINGFNVSGSYNGIQDLSNLIVDQLQADNLQNNISNTEVREAIAKLTSTSGFGLEEAIAKGYQDTVIKYIVPYLDTTTASFESLEMLMPRYF